MNKKTMIENILKEIRGVLMAVEDNRVYETYPVMFTALEKKGLIKTVTPETIRKEAETRAERAQKQKVMAGFDN